MPDDARLIGGMSRNKVVNQRAEVVIAYTPLHIIKAAGSAPPQSLRGPVTK